MKKTTIIEKEQYMKGALVPPMPTGLAPTSRRFGLMSGRF